MADQAVASGTTDPELESIELELLLEGIERRYALDLRGYSHASLRRRLWRRARAEDVGTLSALQERVLHDPGCMERLMSDFSITVTSLFRDPPFHRRLRERVVPLLRTYPFIRIWSAGCSTGEEAVSLAILLHEEGLYERTRIYATDVNASVLEQARAGAFPAEKIDLYADNYREAGGTRSFEDYYETGRDGPRFGRELARNLVFAQHDLASDRSFNEFHLILCRNVLIYFGKALQDRVHALLHDSLACLGVLGLGQRESARFSSREGAYQELDPLQRLYRRRG